LNPNFSNTFFYSNLNPNFSNTFFYSNLNPNFKKCHFSFKFALHLLNMFAVWALLLARAAAGMLLLASSAETVLLEIWSPATNDRLLGLEWPPDEVYPWQCPCLGLSIHGAYVGAWRIRRLQTETGGAHEFTQVRPPGG
jgi:hypothetical protein